MNASIVRSLIHGEPAALCAEFARRQGGIAKLPVPGRRQFWIVSQPKAVADVLNDRLTFDKGGPFYQVISRALGEAGLFTTNDEQLWRRLHDAMWPSLRGKQLAEAGVMSLATELWLRRTHSWNLNAPIELFTELKEFSIELLAAYLFGVEVDSRRLAQQACAVFAGMAGRVFLPASFPGGQRYARVTHALAAEIDAIIAARRHNLPSGTLLDALLQTEPAFTNAQVRDQVMTMLMAGHDSTATVLSWALIRLSEDAAFYANLRHDALASVAAPASVVRAIRAASHEHPAFPMFPRNVAQSTKLQGHRLRKNDQVVVSIQGLQQMTGLGFEGFIEADTSGLTPEQREAHKPFGAGRRKCPGEDFAMLTGSTVLTLLLREFDAIRRPISNSSERSRYAMTAPPRDNAAMWLWR